MSATLSQWLSTTCGLPADCRDNLLDRLQNYAILSLHDLHLKIDENENFLTTLDLPSAYVLNIHTSLATVSFNKDKKLDDMKIVLDRIADKLQQQVNTNVVESLYGMEPPPSNYHDDRSVLGRGTFGVTHRMKNSLDKCLYAVKIIRVKDAQEGGVSLSDLQFEASLLHQVNHPYVVRYFTSFLSNNNALFNLVMELVPGGTLATKIKDSSISLTLIFKWFNQLVQTLYYLHDDMNIQHRDLKPENVLLTVNNDIKIIDLGMATIARSSASKMSKVGTSTYSSYEKANDISYDGRDDVWAAGCVMAELMTRSRLTERGGAIYLYTNRAVNDRRLKLISDCVAVDAGYGAIIGQMLEPEQSIRCTSQQINNILSLKNNNTMAVAQKNDADHIELTQHLKNKVRSTLLISYCTFTAIRTYALLFPIVGFKEAYLLNDLLVKEPTIDHIVDEDSDEVDD